MGRDALIFWFWPGADISKVNCPRNFGADNEASQAMLIAGNNNLSQLKTCLATANNFLLSEENAHAIFAQLIDTIEQNWQAVCEEAELSEVDKSQFWERQFLNPWSIATE